MNPTQDTLDLVKGALRTPDDRITKSITSGTGLVAFDLQAPAKNLYPVVTPIRNSIARVGGGTGTATNWRQVTALTGSGFDSMGWVPEGQRSGQMSYTTASKSAAYVTIGEEDAATYEAISAGRHFEDIQARMTFRLLQKLMLKEEMAILAGNASLQLGTPAAAVLSASGSGATLPTATYSVIVVALTLEGYQNSAVTAGIGVATTKTITGADGKTFVLAGGSSNKSTNATQAVTLGQTLFASVTAIQGASAYAWFVGTAGAETLQAISTINSASFAAPLTGGQQAVSAITADNSANPSYAFDGLLTTALKAGSTAYVSVLPTGTAGTGTPLTASGRGSVVEIDTMFQQMWNLYQVSPTVLYVNVQELKNITSEGAVQRLGAAVALRGRHRRQPVQSGGGGRGVVLLQSVHLERRVAHSDPHSPAGAARHDHRLGRAPAGSVPVERGAERRRGEDPAGLLPDRLAGGDPPAPGRRLRRRGAGGLRAVRDRGHQQYRQRLVKTLYRRGRKGFAEDAKAIFGQPVPTLNPAAQE